MLPAAIARPKPVATCHRSWPAEHISEAGVATSAGVEATARQACEAGFNVNLATDAMTDRLQEAYDYSIASEFGRIGERGTTEEIIDLVEKTRGSETNPESRETARRCPNESRKKGR